MGNFPQPAEICELAFNKQHIVLIHFNLQNISVIDLVDILGNIWVRYGGKLTHEPGIGVQRCNSQEEY